MANNFLDALADYSDTGQTGTLMVVFEDNSIGRFYITGGLLATARYRNREGSDAYALATKTDYKNLRFHENADLVRSGQLIDGLPAPEPTLRPATRSGSATRPVAAGPMLTHVMRTGIKELLGDYVGPVAAVIMGDLPDRVDIDTAIDTLSREITDASEAAEFVRAARAIVSD